MKLLNSGTIAGSGGNGAQYQMPRPVSFPEGKLCERLRVKISQTFTTDATGGALTVANAKALCASFFKSFSLDFGEQAREVVDPSLVFDRMREMHAAMSGRDVYLSIHDDTAASSVFAGQLKDYTQQSLTASHSFTVIVELARAFVFERMGRKMAQFAPGAEQIRQMDLRFTRDAPATYVSGHFTEQSGAASVFVIADTVDDKTNGRWASVPRIRITNLAAQEHPGPSEGGILFGLWETSNAGASTALTLYSLSADEDKIHDNISSLDVQRDSYERLPLSAFDLNTLVTVMYDPPDVISPDQLYAAEKWLWREANGSDISQPSIVWLYVPTVTEQYRDGIIGPNLQDRLGGEVKLVAEHVYRRQPKVPQGLASCMPVVAIARKDGAFTTLPGRLFSKGNSPINHVPDAVTAKIRALHEIHGKDGDTSALTEAVVQAAQAIPGASHPTPGVATQTMLAVAQHVAPASLHGKAGWLSQFTAGLREAL